MQRGFQAAEACLRIHAEHPYSFLGANAAGANYKKLKRRKSINSYHFGKKSTQPQSFLYRNQFDQSAFNAENVG